MILNETNHSQDDISSSLYVCESLNLKNVCLDYSLKKREMLKELITYLLCEEP